MRDRERKADRNRGIYRIAAIHKYAASCIGGQRLLRHHHGMLRANRIFRAGGARESSQCE
jgi:hypothetical protein